MLYPPGVSGYKQAFTFKGIKMLKNKTYHLIFLSLLTLIFFKETNAGRLRQKTKNLNLNLIKEEIKKDAAEKALLMIDKLEQKLKQKNEAKTQLMANQMKIEFETVLNNLQNQIKNKLTLTSKKELDYELEVQNAKKLLTNKTKNELNNELEKIITNKRNWGW